MSLDIDIKAIFRHLRLDPDELSHDQILAKLGLTRQLDTCGCDETLITKAVDGVKTIYRVPKPRYHSCEHIVARNLQNWHKKVAREQALNATKLV